MNDSAFLNDFQRFSNTAGQVNQFPLLPTSSSAVAAQPPTQVGADPSTQALAAQLRSQQEALATMSASLNQLASYVTQQNQTQPHSQYAAPAVQRAPQPNASKASPISTADDVRNAWSLASRSKSSNSQAFRQEVIGIAKRLGLADALPQAAKDWALENNIPLSESQVFSTQVPLSKPDLGFLTAAAAFVSQLSEPDDIFSIYGMVKTRLSHLPAESLTQVMSDFSAYEPAQQLADEAPTLLSATQQPPAGVSQPSAGQPLDELMGLAEATLQATAPAEQPAEPTAAAAEEVDSGLWATAESVAKRRSANPSEEDIRFIYAALSEALSKKTEAKAPLSDAVAEGDFIFADEALWQQSLSEVSPRFADMSSTYAVSYAIQHYRRLYKQQHGSLEGALNLSAEESIEQLAQRVLSTLAQSLAGESTPLVHEDAPAEIDSLP